MVFLQKTIFVHFRIKEKKTVNFYLFIIIFNYCLYGVKNLGSAGSNLVFPMIFKRQLYNLLSITLKKFYKCIYVEKSLKIISNFFVFI